MAKGWMPLYWGDYHQKTQHLSTWQHGAYLLLLGSYWMTGRAIARANARAIARANEEQMGELNAIIDEFFILGRDGLLHNPRMDEELFKEAEISKKRQNAGKKGGKTTQAKAKATGKANDKQMLLQSQGVANAPPTITDTLSREEERRYGFKHADKFAPPLDREAIGKELAKATTAAEAVKAIMGGKL